MRADRKIVSKKLVGQTKAAGFQIGVRKTFPIALSAAWYLLTSAEGTQIWLGEAATLQLVAGEKYTLQDGAVGEIRVVNTEVNIRLTRLAPDGQKASTIQVRTIPHGENTVISFHQEGLSGEKERDEMHLHWQKVLDKLQILIG